MNLINYEPQELLRSFRRDLDELFDIRRRTAAEDSSAVTSRWIPAVDIHEETERYLITADIPGVQPDDVEVTLEKGVLTVKGERRLEREDSDNGWHRLERVYGGFHRRFVLPDTADGDRIEARVKDGVLTISVAKREQAQPRRISVAS